MANDYVFFDPRKKAQQQEEDKKKLTEKEGLVCSNVQCTVLVKDLNALWDFPC